MPAAQDLRNFATPPCFKHAPERVAACQYVPSLHCAIASVGSLSAPRLVAGLVAAFGAVGARDFASDLVRAGELAGTADGRLGVVDLVAGTDAGDLIPPWPEQAP